MDDAHRENGTVRKREKEEKERENGGKEDLGRGGNSDTLPHALYHGLLSFVVS